MQVWRNSQQRTWSRHLAWFLALLLFLSPLLVLAHASLSPADSSGPVNELPCHQHQPDTVQSTHYCTHCNEGQMDLGCDCCDVLMPISLTLNHNLPFSTPGSAIAQPWPYLLKRPEPPLGSLYRPPIQRLN